MKSFSQFGGCSMQRAERNLRLFIIGLRLVGWRAVLPVLRRLMNLERLARLTSAPRSVERDEILEMRILRIAARLWRSSSSPCLERSLAVHRLLGVGGARPELVLGLSARHEGHAWVELDGHALMELDPPRSRFREIARFDASGHAIPTNSTSH